MRKVQKVAVGIDPGQKGFVSLIIETTEGVEYESYPLPVLKGGFVDFKKLKEIFTHLAKYVYVDNCIFHCAIEDVHAIPGSSAGATFSFGYIVGVLESYINEYALPYTKVAPKTWQKEMWAGISLIQKKSSTGKTMVTDTKKMSLQAFNRLFPKIDARRTERCSVPDDNKVDSFLIAEYVKRKFI